MRGRGRGVDFGATTVHHILHYPSLQGSDCASIVVIPVQDSRTPDRPIYEAEACAIVSQFALFRGKEDLIIVDLGPLL